MNDQPQNQQPQTDLMRLRDWLSGDVRVSRTILVVGGVLLIIIAGIALD